MASYDRSQIEDLERQRSSWIQNRTYYQSLLDNADFNLSHAASFRKNAAEFLRKAEKIESDLQQAPQQFARACDGIDECNQRIADLKNGRKIGEFEELAEQFELLKREMQERGMSAEQIEEMINGDRSTDNAN